VTFLVSAAALNPSYQWRKNGVNLANGGRISGATTNRLTITNVADNDAAFYSVTVTNLLGSAMSSNAALTVIDPPGITAQPLDRHVLLGGAVSFCATVSGTPPFNYQWRFNGGSILSATNAAYAIQAVAGANTGNYSVVVTNPAGSVTSSNALLTVIIPPRLSLQMLSGYPLLNLDGMLHSNIVVQYRTNLAGSNWINLFSVPDLYPSPYEYYDVGTGRAPARFYRAFMQ
jgi:Immunoglobulin I-set domain